MEFEELRAIRLVFWREYLIRVLTPSFVVTTLATPRLLLVVGALPAVFAAPHLFAHKHIVVACDDPMLGPLLRDRLLKSSPLGRHKVDLVTDTTPQERRQLAGMVRESRVDGFFWVCWGGTSAR